MISRSLQVPGSPSSAFTTRYLGLWGPTGRSGYRDRGDGLLPPHYPGKPQRYPLGQLSLPAQPPCFRGLCLLTTNDRELTVCSASGWLGPQERSLSCSTQMSLLVLSQEPKFCSRSESLPDRYHLLSMCRPVSKQNLYKRYLFIPIEYNIHLQKRTLRFKKAKRLPKAK